MAQIDRSDVEGGYYYYYYEYNGRPLAEINIDITNLTEERDALQSVFDALTDINAIFEKFEGYYKSIGDNVANMGTVYGSTLDYGKISKYSENYTDFSDTAESIQREISMYFSDIDEKLELLRIELSAALNPPLKRGYRVTPASLYINDPIVRITGEDDRYTKMS